MSSADNGVKSFLVELSSPQTLTEVIAILVAVLVALGVGQAVKAWRRRQGEPLGDASWAGQVLEGAFIVAPILFTLVLLLAARALLAAATGHTAVIDTALQLVTVLLLVRVGVYGLRLLLGTETWFDAWESRIALIVWLMIGFQLVGWFEKVEATLEHINLIPGRNTFTLWALLKGIVVVTVFVFVTTLIARTLERRMMRLDAIALSTRIGISKFSYFLLVGIGVLLGINAAGVDVTTLNVLTGAIGLGLGFGLQTIAGNFVSGFVLLIDKSIKPGDVISFTGHTGTSTENFGWVQELRGRYVVVRDRDGVETLVPNQNLITNSVINWSYSDQRVRIRLPVMVSYDDDPELALKVLLDAARDHPRILREPHPVSRLMAFEDYGIRLEVRFWIADPMNGVNNVRSDVNRAIWRMFRDHAITIPVAQREIRVVEPKAAARRQRELLAERDPDAG
jgi:small-conductance mechanosensitive channel